MKKPKRKRRERIPVTVLETYSNALGEPCVIISNCAVRVKQLGTYRLVLERVK